jgi:hypothetical protein
MTSPLGIALIVAGVLFMALATACSGLDTGDFVRIKVDEPIRKAQGTAPTITLNESYRVLEDYVRDGERFAADIQEAEERRAYLDSLVNMGAEIAVPVLGEVPGGAILTTLLFGAGGLLAGRKSGEAKAKTELQTAIKQAADAAWDEAEAKAVEKVRAGVEIAKGA